MKIPYNISLFFKGVFVINYGTRKFLYPYSSGCVKGRGEKGVFVMNMEQEVK